MGIIVLSLLVFAVLVFTSLYFLFRKLKPGVNPVSRPGYWLTSIIATPVLFLVFLFIWFSASSSYEAKTFDKEDWTENQESRYVYVDDLIESEKLIGLTGNELKGMLGKADYEDESTLEFYIGYSPKKFMNMAPDWLIADLVEGKVSYVYVRE